MLIGYMRVYRPGSRTSSSNLLGRYAFTLPDLSREVSSDRCVNRAWLVSMRRDRGLV
jgi:hypothetical protein